MQKSEAQIFAAELGLKIPQLDLHEKYPHEIIDEVKLFLLENYNQDKEMVRIIYGGGAGKMREEVLGILKSKEMKSIIDSVDVKEGSCVVVFNG
jgi:dsDNA-specific endonuclease/ATPase MutS2